MLRYYLPFVILLILASCKKKVKPDPPANEDTPALKELWVKPLVEEGGIASLSTSGFIYDDHVYFSDENEAALKGYPLDGEGDIQVLAQGQFHSRSGKHETHLHGSDLYICSDYSKLQKLDMRSGSITDLYQGTDKMGPQLSVDEGLIYFEDEGPTSALKRSLLLRLDEQTKELDTIMDYDMPDGWQGRFLPPLIFEHNSRKLLAFQLRMTGPNAIGRQDYYVYDVEADSVVWSQIAIDDNAGSVDRPVVDDQRIYWMGNTSVFALDIETGDLVWEHKNPDQKAHWHGIMFMYGNKLFVKSDGLIMVALDPITGNIHWQNDQLGSTPGNTYDILDGVFCYYSKGKGKFVAVDLQSGRTLMYEDPPVRDRDGTFTMASSIVIDQDTRRLYYTNYYDVVCAEIAPFE